MTAEPVSVAFPAITAAERYKLLVATVIPRPIALLTTVEPDGTVNAAPFSFFNVFSEDPAIVVLGLQHKPDRSAKDTSRNIAVSGAFVVNLVDEELAEAMNTCAVDFPAGTSEIDAAGLTLLPGEDVPVPRIAEAPFALECRRTVALAFSATREIVLGEVLRLHARAGLLDPGSLRVDPEAFRPIGRLFANLYSRQGDRFELERESHAAWRARDGR